MTTHKTYKRAKSSRKYVDGWNNRVQFAERAGRHRQTIWRWEREGLLPDPDGHDPYGNKLWRSSTIDSFLAGNSEAA